MKKKVLYIVIVLILVLLTIFLIVLKNNKKDYYVISNDKQEKAIKIGLSKNDNYVIKENEGKNNTIEFWNEKENYRIEISIRDVLKTSYESNLRKRKNNNTFDDIKINKFVGYQYNSVMFGKHIYLILDDADEETYNILYVYVGRISDYTQPIDNIFEIKDCEKILKSIKITPYIKSEEK